MDVLLILLYGHNRKGEAYVIYYAYIFWSLLKM